MSDDEQIAYHKAIDDQMDKLIELSSGKLIRCDDLLVGANNNMKLTNEEITQIGNAVREALATPEDKRSIEDIVRGVFAIKCDFCGNWIPRFTLPKSTQERIPFQCVECSSTD